MMIEELYNYYCKNLTYNSCILKLIPWYIRRPIFLCFYIALFLAVLVIILPMLTIIESFIYSICPILLGNLSIVLLCIASLLMVIPFMILDNHVKKVIKTNDKLRHIYDYQKDNWSRRDFQLYLLQNLERHLINEKIQFKKLDKVIEGLQHQIDKGRRIMVSFFVTFGILIIPIWEKIVDNISYWCIKSGMPETKSLIVLILFVIFLSILRHRLEYILNDYYKIRYVGLSDLRDLLLELQMKDYNFPKV